MKEGHKEDSGKDRKEYSETTGGEPEDDETQEHHEPNLLRSIQREAHDLEFRIGILGTEELKIYPNEQESTHERERFCNDGENGKRKTDHNVIEDEVRTINLESIYVCRDTTLGRTKGGKVNEFQPWPCSRCGSGSL